MTLSANTRNKAAGLAVTAGLVALIGGCASSPADSADGGSAAKNPACAALGKKYPGLAGKSLSVGIAPAPANYSATDPKDPENVIGIEPDLLKAAGDCLGFDVSYTKLDFGGLIPALQSGRIDLVAAGMYASAERAKLVNFAQYMKAGEASLVKAGNPKGLTSLDKVCDVTAAEVVGTVENAILDKQNAECAKTGKGPITPLQFPSNDRAYSALTQGRADILLTDAGVASYLAAKTPDQVAVGFSLPTDFVFGFGVSKKNTELLNGLTDSLKQQYTDGALKAAVKKWGFADNQLIEPSAKTS